MKEKSSLYYKWLALLGVAIIAGLITLVQLFREGHGLFNTNDVLIWSLPLGVYLFLALTSSGLALLSALPLLLGFKEYMPFAKRMVFLTVATLCGAFASIALELGSIHHLLYIMLSPNLSSPIWWMGAIYSLELLVLVLKLWKMHVGDWDSLLSRFLNVASFILALSAPLMIGSVFGLTESRATFFGPMMAVYCLSGAFLNGVAQFLLYSMVLHKVTGTAIPKEHEELYNKLSVLFGYAIGLVVIFTLLRATMEAATTIPDFLHYHKFRHGFGAWQGFHIEVILGLYVPLYLILFSSIRKSVVGRMVTAALVQAGVFYMYLESLILGQSRPVGPKAEQYPQFISYFPNVWEFMVFAFALAVMLLLYTMGEKYLRLAEAPE
jgi:molybdopterin-containing oxidoreductase family membrane subunit